jgi:FkbM family methyltransferase
MHTIHHDRWFGDNGNETVITNYNLKEDSWVLELGGYEGWWTDKMLSKHKCKVIVVEPVFTEAIYNRFRNNPNVFIHPKAITGDKRKVTLNVSGDGTSETLVNSSHQVTVDSITLQEIIEMYKIDRIGLIQMNIEGEEFNLMPALIESKIITKCDNIQIQFHNTNPSCPAKREAIQQGLRDLGFELNWNYEFVWESWKNINK